jgi:hypothetical protein
MLASSVKSLAPADATTVKTLKSLTRNSTLTSENDMTSPNAPTLAEFLAEHSKGRRKLFVTKKEPASWVPPRYAKKPKSEQVMTGLANVLEVTFSNGMVRFMCVEDEKLYVTAASAAVHRSHHGRAAKDKTEEQQAEAVAREMSTVVLNDVVIAMLKRLGVEEITFEALAQQYLDMRDSYENMYESYKTQLDYGNRLNDDIKKLEAIVKDYEEQAFPKHLRIKFIEMMAETMESVGDKWLEIVQENRTHHAKVDKIIKS